MSSIVPMVTKTAVSASALHSRQRALQLYRKWVRYAPKIQSDYLLDLDVAEIRHKIRQEFEKQRFVTDPKQIDILIMKGTMELEETLAIWKQKTHVMRWWAEEEMAEDNKGPLAEAEMTWLERFYANKN